MLAVSLLLLSLSAMRLDKVTHYRGNALVFPRSVNLERTVKLWRDKRLHRSFACFHVEHPK
jgi:hypothetical protein